MLELRNIKKSYITGESVTKALDDVSVVFREKEFVAILGSSGSGKTTMLNVIGGLDKYDSGDLIISGTSTKTFTENDWDAYRNNSIGFIFQSYNLISHLGIIDNVELGMTLSGVSKEEKRERATDALIRVGLKEHMHKKPNQLSGGQMQRVAIARALANNPDILLCDEPTGALDTATSIQIMNLIKELSKEKLVIMVTHNPELAHEYVDRVIEFSDGQIQSDSNPYVEEREDNGFQLKPTKMKFTTALKLSFNNIRTKKGRVFLTSLASSIGIIGIATVLSLSNGFKKQIDDTQKETMSQFPITISSQGVDMMGMNPESLKPSKNSSDVLDESSLLVKKDVFDDMMMTNHITEDYLDYLNGIDENLVSGIVYTKSVGLNLLREVNGEVKPVSFENYATGSISEVHAEMGIQTPMSDSGVSVFPIKNEENFLNENYNLIKGAMPAAYNEIVLVLDSEGRVNKHTLNNLGFEVEEDDKVLYDDIIGTTMKLVHNDDYYMELPTGNYIPNNDLESVYDNSNNIELEIVGVIQAKEESKMALLSSGIAYSNQLIEAFIEQNKDSQIVNAQKASDKNVMTNEVLDESSKGMFLSYLGENNIPDTIMVYPNNYEDKDTVLSYLDDYNDNKSEENQVKYTDMAGTMTELTGGLMDAITYVLIAFAGISLVTSMIMIGIITYTSVIERTKEIGILKALGARKKDITRVFDAETCILGLSSGILGVVIAYGLTFPINSAIYALTELENCASLNPVHAIVLVIVSTVLTVMGGHIPAKMAANKDAVIALRAE